MILKTKLQAPQVKTGTVERTRFIKLLNDNVDKKLILINAGAGYGKTTLLSQFLAQTDMPRVFYHLDASDSEPVTFFSYLNAGIAGIHPRFGRRIETILRTRVPSDDSMEMIVGTFINEFVEKVSTEMLIALDDYHNLDPSGQIDKTLDYLLTHAPRNLHLIIATRLQPNFPITNLKARNDLVELTSEDLRFNRDDIDQLFRGIHGFSLDAEELRALEEHSEGWVTSLQLILQASGRDLGERIKSCLPQPQIKNSGTWWSDYFNYFAQEIYDREPLRVQNFMVKTSILEWLDHEICNEITGRRDSETTLDYLEQRNAFVSRMPDGNYRFHHLFRDFLISKWHDMRLKKKTLLRAANHFHRRGKRALAIPYYVEAEHHKQAASLIQKVGYEMTDSGKSRTVVSFIAKLPKETVNESPELLMVYSYAQMSDGYPNEAITNAIKATRLLVKEGKHSQKLAQAYYDLGSIHFNLGNFETAKRWLMKALKASPTKRALSNAAMLNALGLIYSKGAGRKLKDAIACFKKASSIVKKCPYNKGLEASIINNWAMSERKSGNLIDAHRKFAQAVELLKKEANFSPQFGSIFYNAVRLSLYLGESAKAAAILRLGQALSMRYNDRCSLAIIWRGYSIFYEDQGNLNTALEYLKKALGIFEGLHLNRMIALVNKDCCRIYTALDQLAEAEQTLAEIWRLKRSRDDADAVSIHITEARLRIAQSKILNAENLLTRAIELAKKYALTYEHFLALLEWARLMHTKGPVSEAAKALRHALRLSEERSYGYSLSKFMKKERWSIGSFMAMAEAYTTAVIKRWQVPYHLVEVHLFGIPRIVVDGKKIEARAWKTSKALKLSCYLCSHHDQSIPRDILIDALWKETSQSSGARNLRKAMHHIRQAFGTVITDQDNPVIYRNKKYRFTSDFSVWLDIEEFEGLIRKAKKARSRSQECQAYIMKALALYQDGYAKGWFDDWVEAMRGYYGEKYEEGLVIMADIALHQRKNFREGALWCKKLTGQNPYDETYRMKLWAALAKLRRINDIRKDFNDLNRTLKKELKTSPQRQTVEFYNSLVK